ncbi:MAG: hypothetical protein GOMPHAMPRED_004208 [Gomphillus americanus]|uniref:Uncharacterized protein n=1 Tax=Gomphillus americanus TaxID=1940652 RepID=A0A8H3FMT2_9LECA|nr:MAG: hypothetical protein GOMPHAMPRED_004208 [Gomphillus americanus]
MAQKCVHKGCGKRFTDAEEICIYHPGPPIFHEGQKGWKCCKARVLTFDEFLVIPPCTTGIHSTIDDTPQEARKPDTDVADKSAASQTAKLISEVSIESTDPAPATRTAVPQQPPSIEAEPESDEDNPELPIPSNATCRRRGCDVVSTKIGADREPRVEENCTHHPGHPIFHEGSKGWSCCKRRVLEFDEFLRIEGCNAKPKHMFVGSGKKAGKDSAEKTLTTIRHDFYQTGTTIHASLYLKKISKADAKVAFSSPTTISVDLPTADKTRYKETIPLYGLIDPAKSNFKVLGTKLELSLAKADGQGWPVLRADDRPTGEIIQTGKAGRAS